MLGRLLPSIKWYFIVVLSKIRVHPRSGSRTIKDYGYKIFWEAMNELKISHFAIFEKKKETLRPITYFWPRKFIFVEVYKPTLLVQLCAYKPYIWYIDCRYCIYHCAIKCNVKLWHFRGKKFPGQISSGFRFCLKFSGFVHFSKSIIQLLSKQCLVMITHVQDVPRTSGSGFCFDTNPVSYKPHF